MKKEKINQKICRRICIFVVCIVVGPQGCSEFFVWLFRTLDQQVSQGFMSFDFSGRFLSLYQVSRKFFVFVFVFPLSYGPLFLFFFFFFVVLCVLVVFII